MADNFQIPRRVAVDGLTRQQAQFIDETFRNFKPMKLVAYQRSDVGEYVASAYQFRGCVEDALQV